MVTYDILRFAGPHYYYGGGAGSGWWWVIGFAWHLLFLGLLVAGIVFLVRALSRRPATGPYFAAPVPPVAPPPAANDPAASLGQAKALFDQGLITEAEYEGIRQTILSRMQDQPPA